MQGTEPQRSVGSVKPGDLEFRRLLEALPAAAYTCDPDGLITYFNSRAVELWGREPKLNDPVDRFCGSFRLFSAEGAPIAHRQCWMALALQNDREYNGHEILIERPDGSRRTALAHANPSHDDGGGLAGAVNVLVDISDRKEAEIVLRDADRRKTEFLAMLAHELRNPLAPLSNSLEILKISKDDSEAFDRAREMMERQLHQMVRLVDDLLDVSRITSNKLKLRTESLELSSIVQQTIDMCRLLVDRAQLELIVAVPSEPIRLNADPVRLIQVLSNLIHNACKFTEPGGHIWLTATRDGNELVLSIRDDGVGIPPDVLPRVFDMFTQADPLERSHGGLGIGLTLVQALVHLHGGSIEARSDGERKGSEFIVRLPVLLGLHPVPQPKPSETARNATTSRRVLVADDHPDAATSLGMLLRLTGNETRVVQDGLEAVEAADQFRPDVALLDIGMPGLNGYEACRRIREQPWGKSIVMIALTGWGQEQDRQLAREAGFDSHLVKPVDPAALARLIAAVQPVQPVQA